MRIPEMIALAGDICANIEEQEGEITAESQAKIEELLEATGDKLGSLLFLRNAARARKAEAAEYIEIFTAQKRKEERAELKFTSMAKSVLQSIAETGEKPIVRKAWGTCSLGTRETATVMDAEAVIKAGGFHKETITRKPDLAKIKAALKAGKEVPGAALVKKSFATWRTK